MTSVAPSLENVSGLMVSTGSVNPLDGVTPVIAPSPASGDVVIATLHAGWPRRLGVPLAFWTVAFFSAALATGAGYRDLARWAAIGPGVVGLFFGITLWLRRAVIRQTDVEVRSIWGVRRVRYEDVRSFTFDARSYRFYLPIPIGRVAKLSLKGRRARAIFHAGFARFDKYAPVIIDRVIEATVKRMRTGIDRGERATFGRKIHVDRRHLYMQRWPWGFRAIPIDDMKIEVADGDFILSTQAGKKLGVFALKNTPNLLALPQLIDELSATAQQPVPTALREAVSWKKPRK